MTDNPLVSVLIPLYNAEKYFDECIQSVLNQSYKNIEVIIVNDGSTDGSLEIAKKYEKKYSHIKVYSQENRGAAAARNKAFSFSAGEYIQYLDADDIMDPEKISFQIDTLGMYNFDPMIIASSKWARFYSNIDNAVFKELCTYKNYENPLLYLVECWHSFQCFIGTTWLTSRKLHEQIGNWDESLSVHDDYIFFAKVVYISKKIIYVDQSIVYWRQDNLTSLSKTTSWQGMYSHLKVCDQLSGLVQNNLSNPDLKYALAMEYSKFIYRAYPMYDDLVGKAELALKDLGYNKPLAMPTKKFRLATKIIGFYPTARLFGAKDKLIKKIRRIMDK